MIVEQMVTVDIEKILSETGLSPRALAKVAGLNWSQFRKVRSRGTMRRDDAKRFADNVREHSRSGKTNTALSVKRNGEIFRRPVVRVAGDIPFTRSSTPSNEIERLISRL